MNTAPYFSQLFHMPTFPDPILTHSMVQSPSWEANWFAASQEIPRISRNPKVPYRTYKRPPLVPILGQPNPVHIPTSHFLETHPNIIHPSTPRSPHWSPSLQFPQQDARHPYMPHAQPIYTSIPHILQFYFLQCYNSIKDISVNSLMFSTCVI